MMHIEKNVAASLFKTFSNCKGTKADGIRVRNALAELKMHRELHAIRNGEDRNGNPKFMYAPAPWVWTPSEYERVISTIRSIRTPTGYGSSFMYKFTEDKKITGMKIHDWHNMLHDILPIVICGTLIPQIRKIIYRLSSLFRWMWGKEIKEIEIEEKKQEAIEILCLIEIHLPPIVLDGQFHQIIHLVPEVEYVGPVSFRWMYFLERYMKEIKSWVRQKAHPEGSMAEGYIVSEAMHYLTEYVQRLDKNAPQLWTAEEDISGSSVVLPRRNVSKVIPLPLFHYQ
jgi:hypothetical protein